MGKHEPSRGASDEWYTPAFVFEALGCTFDMDVSAPRDVSRISTPARLAIVARSLEIPWEGFVWMNPPFGGRNALQPWLEKFFAHGAGIALTPDRTSAPWWQWAAARSDATFFWDGKIKFIPGPGVKESSPANGTCLFASGPRGVAALQRAAGLGRGLLMERRAAAWLGPSPPADRCGAECGAGPLGWAETPSKYRHLRSGGWLPG